jgi:hypothetical protein
VGSDSIVVWVRDAYCLMQSFEMQLI